MTKAEKDRARYRDRRARGVCVDCETPSDGKARCADCRRRDGLATAIYQRENPESSRERMKRLYWQDPEKFRARARQRRLDKKVRGECLKCPEPAMDGSNHCAACTEREHRVNRDYGFRKRRGLPLKRGGAPVGVTRTPMPAVLCACGSPATVGSCCARCAHLDGDGKHGAVIAALRLSDGMSLLELCEALDMDTGLKNGRRQMWRWVKDLLEQGRVRRYWRESTGTDEHAVFNGSGKALNAIGCWAYALDGKTEREWRRHAA